MKRFIALLIFLFTCWLPTLKAQNLMFAHMEVRDGLPNNTIAAILKDSKGFMWFGTASGLARYDGYNFRTFLNHKKNTHSLPDNYVDYIIEDKEENLWMRAGGEYVIYDMNKECFITDLSDYYQRAELTGNPHYVYVDKKGNYWFFQNWTGCYHYNRESKEAKKLFVGEESLPATQICSMQEYEQWMLLIFNNGEIYAIDQEELTISWKLDYLSSLMPKGTVETYSMFKDSQDLLWVYSVQGVWVYDLKNKRWYNRLNQRLARRNIMPKSIAEDWEGRIWIGMDQDGIDIWDRKKRTFSRISYNREQVNGRGLQHNTISVLYADNNDVMWVGTYKKGVSYYNESIYKFGIQLLGDINCIEDASDGCLWLGTNESGLIHWNPKNNERRAYVHSNEQSITSDVIVSLLKARDGKLWIGTYWGGLDCFDGTKFKHYKHQLNDSTSLANNNVWSLAEDNEGNIWVATLGGGLQCLNPRTDKLTSYNIHNSGLHSDYIASICYSKRNQIIIGTASEGVTILDLNTRTFHHLSDESMGGVELSNQSINHVYEDSRGLIWIATRDGLNMYDFERKKLTQVYSSMTSERFISGIVEDDDGNMWVTTARGLTNVIVSQLEKSSEYSFQYYLYDNKDGLQSSEFNQRSIKRLNNGEIVMGGLYGINIFHPADIKYNKIVPKVMFSAFKLFNQQVEVGASYDGRVVLEDDLNSVDKVSLSYSQNIFTIQFASDSYILPKKTKYIYKLEGFNDNWMTLSEGQTQVTYTNLSPGTYNLVVKAINSDEVAGSDVSSLKIEILPPFWKTPWAYTIYVVVLLLVFYLALMLIKHRERNRFKIRQMEEDAKKKEEMTQMKFRFFTNVSHELRTPLTLIISPLESMMRSAVGKQQEQLTMMHRNAVNLLDLVNQLLDFRKMEMAGMSLKLKETDIVSVVRMVVNSFAMISEKKQIGLTFHSDFNKLEMAFDEDKVSKVVTNLLSNAFKFTPTGGRVTVTLELSKNVPDNLLMKVADTGIGISDKDKAHIFDSFYQADLKGIDNQSTGSGIGLSLVRDFVEMHHGSVQVQDNEGRGAVFVIELPIIHSQETDINQVIHASLLVDSEETTNAEDISTQSIDDFEYEEITSEEAARQLDKAERNKPLALVVDDNEDIVSFLVESLSLYFRVKSATNGREAWQMLPDLMPDIVVSDVMMPEMDGNELCRWIKSDSRTEHIPVILLTAKHAVEDTVESLSIGADDYMTKPFNVEVLVLRMRKLIELYTQKQKNNIIDPVPSEVKITSLDEELVASAIKYVEENISRANLSVEELSQSLGMSRVHLYKKLLQITGKTPIEFIRVIRLKRAAQMLRESQRNVSEIAYQLGFNNPKYFAKYFKDEFGVLPSVYQTQGRKKQNIP